MSNFLDALAERVILFDGAMGTLLQGYELSPADFRGCENCSEILNFSRPEVVVDVHDRYLRAGADAVETNTFGAHRLLLEEFGLGDRVREVNETAVALAREAADRYHEQARPRFVVGSVGPGTRLPSLGQARFEQLEEGYREQGFALLGAGVDALLVETCQDILQSKAAVVGLLSARREMGLDTPIMLQVTLQPGGAMLVGTDITTVLAIVEPYPVEDIATVGINCASGPEEMASAVALLSRRSRRPFSVQPNAGLPRIRDGKPHYVLSPSAFADWMERFVREDGVAIVGGCCGTSPEHIAALAERVSGLRPRQRTPEFEPSLSSLYRPVALRQEADILSIGERTNANGSDAFRKRLRSADWEGIVHLGRAQIKQGSHAVDLCTALVGRDELSDMTEVVSRFRAAVDAPLVIDSTELPVIEAALRLHGGRCLVNSINLEDGGKKAHAICELARRYGAALIALCIDEQGMARSPEHKLAVAERLAALAAEHGLAEHDLLFDPLTFTLGTGQAADRRLGLDTLEGIALIAARFPRAGILLGISNISFGLAPAPRHVLNAVFLHHARQRGLTAAIVHQSRIVPLFRIPEERRLAAEDLIFDRGEDSLQRFLALFQGESATAEAAEELLSRASLPVGERLALRIVEGDAEGIEDDLRLALESMDALAIINQHLLGGMKTVGELFGRGATQLPFVLQSAETMKKAVAMLEPELAKLRSEGTEARSRGRILLATVRGDVHDIGKNLVGILLSNNGFEVVDVGIRRGFEEILAAIEEHRPDALGLSGLLVRSTAIMRETLGDLRRRGVRLPVILGGAALTRSFVAQDCSWAWGMPVAYARDAFDGLRFMEELESARMEGRASRFGTEDPELQEPQVETSVHPPGPSPATFATVDTRIPAPPFSGARLLEIGPEALLPLLDETRLFTFRWGYSRESIDKGGRRSRQDLRDLMRRLLDQTSPRLRLRAAYGYFPCHGDGDGILLYDPAASGDSAPIARLPVARRDGRSIADFLLQKGAARDLIALQAVTVGPGIAEIERAFWRENAFSDYHHLHGIGVELAECFAAFVHMQIRRELGLAERDPRSRRYSFGYPACPELGAQAALLELLGAGRIDIELGDELQLVPELSTTAMVFHRVPSTR